MYQTVESFIQDYRNESESTSKLLSALTDESLRQEMAPGYRTLGHLAWHLVPSGGILHPTGLTFDAPPERSAPPATAAAIAEKYRKTADSLMEAVRTQWTDEKLQETSIVFGQPWKNGLTLYLFLKHEVHHRGQLTILMRLAGLPVTGVYGPSKEEWAAIGMEAPAL
ncbi:DinB family protein [Paenibacillus filicis]|uniref:DinB family protein n=1 Tax=Paenibacillus gyeongsangnamensis TaxID=3388067 RepID=A0ABT4QHC4_9BACL|nr:DinB family protein [Paenibacillus filicis]MCZ8516245.1 DinB family protein [Paenibacillus filicis]